MLASELIKELQKIIDEKGDMFVSIPNIDDGCYLDLNKEDIEECFGHIYIG
jgi:hypothetical protein